MCFDQAGLSFTLLYHPIPELPMDEKGHCLVIQIDVHRFQSFDLRATFALRHGDEYIGGIFIGAMVAVREQAPQPANDLGKIGLFLSFHRYRPFGVEPALATIEGQRLVFMNG